MTIYTKHLAQRCTAHEHAAQREREREREREKRGDCYA